MTAAADSPRDRLSRAIGHDDRDALHAWIDRYDVQVLALIDAAQETYDVLDGPRGGEAYVRGQCIARLAAAVAPLVKEPEA